MGALLHLIRSADVRIYYFLSRFAQNWVLARLAGLEESNDLIKGGVYFALCWHLWFSSDGEKEKRRKAVTSILIAAVLSIIVTRFIAFVSPFRLRPMYDPALIHASFPIEIHYNLVRWSSFPSDTAAYFCALAFGIAYLSRRLAVPIALYTVIWVCLSRMYLGIHFASDMVAGAAIGIAVAWIFLRSAWIQSICARPARVAETRPQWFYPLAFLVSFEMATIFAGLRNLGNHAMHFLGIGLHIGFLRTGPGRVTRPLDVWGGFIALVVFAVIVGWIIRASSGPARIMMARLRRKQP